MIIFNKIHLEACTSSATKHTSIPKALQFILRDLDRDSDPVQIRIYPIVKIQYHGNQLACRKNPSYVSRIERLH